MQIIQLTNMTYKQTMGYVFRAKTGEVLVVDGGHQGNHRELERILTRCGGHVDLWLVTHPHSDHYTAIIDLMKCGTSVTWDRLGAGVLPDDWGADSEDGDGGEIVVWNAFVPKLGDKFFEIKEGQRFQLGSMTVEILAGNNPDLKMNPINNQSCVFRITEGDFSIIILGALGEEAGDRLLSKGYDLRADAVQMAHHGQNGVKESVYQAIAPKYAFWPTPLWLFVNSRTKQLIPDSATYQTPEVIGWMRKLKAINIVSFDHTVMFDTETKLFGPY